MGKKAAEKRTLIGPLGEADAAAFAHASLEPQDNYLLGPCMGNAILLFVLTVLACPAIASTDCTSTVATLMVETGQRSRYVVTFESGLAFTMNTDSGN